MFWLLACFCKESLTKLKIAIGQNRNRNIQKINSLINFIFHFLFYIVVFFAFFDYICNTE